MTHRDRWVLVSDAFNPLQPAICSERQNPAHIALDVDPGVTQLRFWLATFFQYFVHPRAVFAAPSVDQVPAATN